MKTIDQIREEERAAQDEYERATVAYSFTVRQMREAFEKVQNLRDWKAPIRAQIKIEDLALTMLAIGFYHGNQPHVTSTAGGYVIIQSNGYEC